MISWANQSEGELPLKPGSSRYADRGAETLVESQLSTVGNEGFSERRHLQTNRTALASDRPETLVIDGAANLSLTFPSYPWCGGKMALREVYALRKDILARKSRLIFSIWCV
jgi:hypothetical protein